MPDSIAIGQDVVIQDKDKIHHITNVLRKKIGDELRLFNAKDGEFVSQIAHIAKNQMIFAVNEATEKKLPDKPLFLAMSLIKADRMNEAIKAAVQLGVSDIIPVISARTQYRQVASDKLVKIIIQSVEQSERLAVPTLHSPIKLEQLPKMNGIDQIIFANEAEQSQNIANANFKLDDNICVLIGPEGGFTKDESEYLSKYEHISSVSLGHNVLRSEVAAITALACIQMLRSC